MSNTWKRFLSLLLAVVMILSLGVTGFADEGEEGEPAETPEDEIVTPEEPAEEPAEESEPDGGNLEMEEISPDKLNVPKLGLEESSEEDGDELIPMDEEDLNQVVRVSIFLNSPSTMEAGYSAETAGFDSAAIAYRDGLRAQQAEVTAQIESVIGHPLNVKWNLTLAVNAISAEVTLGEIVKIQAIPGVRSVQRENQYLPMTGETADPDTASTSENMVGATTAWAAGYTGAGSRIAIIDTGIDITHQSFAAEPFNYAIQQAGATNELMTEADISRVLSQLNASQKMSGVTAAQLNRSGGGGSATNAKIPYGFNYVDGSLTINHTGDTQGEHGSHVAGIAAANRFIGTAHQNAAETVGAVGMAPDAQLLIMKVFGSNGGAYDSDYMAAIEDAMLLGADVANLSLGSAVQGWTFDNDDNNDYQDMILGWANKEHNAKMVLSISAGNSYDLAFMMPQKNLYVEDVSMHTGGSPGTFLNSLCVAAAQNTMTTGTPMEFNGSQDVFYYESTGNEEEGTTYTNPELTTIVGTYNYVYIDAVGTADDYSAVNSAVGLSGKVVIVNRGDISFIEKGENAKSYSPKAVIIANNQDGTIYMDLTDFTGTFPMVTITLKDANQIKEGGTAHTTNGITYYTGSMKVTNTEKSVLIDRSEATITDFSSWGVPGSLIMKPEITAPGGDIYSVAGTNTTTSGGTAGGSDQYEYMSGTSMAAPHIAGLTAVLAEYLRENNLVEKNAGLAGYSTRAIAQSLMMSTATPMKPEGRYLPILQQGSGLADVSKAVTVNSIIMMDPANSGLTGKTGAAADGKVKVELGDDPGRVGDYSFGFTVYNLTDDDLHFNVSTDVFTQAIEDGEYMSRRTASLGASASFWWAPIDGAAPVEGHDVDRDGDTDADDAQAILDYLSGKIEDESILDLEAGEMDGDGQLTTQDAYLLLGYEPAEGEGYANGVVPAHSSRYCAIRITLPDSTKSYLDENYPGGAYIEGFTYVTSDTTATDGAVYADAHSIPILGFYGSWTDASMFDTAPYVEKLYGSEQENYTGNETTNYLTLQMNGANVKFSGNPYKVEESFPADRLAINSNTAMLDIRYNLIRAAGTTGFAVTKLDADHQVTEVVSSVVTGDETTGIWYNQSGGAWQGLTQKVYSVNKTPGSYGLVEGDRFRVGFYAIPEYNAMLVNEDYTSADAGMLDQTGFNTLLMSNVLGKGAFVGYDFVVDNTEPSIVSAELNGSQLSISATDNQALAYVAVMSLDGTVVYAEATPGTGSYTIELDASDAVANAKGYVAVFAGDYAGNETAMAVQVNDDCYEEKTVYVLTDTLTAGEEYLIVNSNAAGTGYALGYTAGTWSNTVTTNRVTVIAGNNDTSNKPYIDSKDVATTSVWASSGNTNLRNGNYYLRRSSDKGTTLQVSATNTFNTWQYNNNQLRFTDRATYLRYNNNRFELTTTASNIYLYQKTVIRTEIDPYGVTEVTIMPESLNLYKGNTADLTAKVLPLTATDRTVTWSSANNNIATVDEFGRVTAVAKGTTTIRATANGDPTKYAECSVTVEAIDKTLNAFAWDEEGKVWAASFNANNLPTWTKSTNNAVGTYLTNAFMVDASNLYASTCDLSDTSVIYTVNRSTYALTEVGNNYVPAFGMARAGTSFGTGYYVYGFAKYLIFGNLTPETDDELGTFCGFPYGMLDLSTTNVGDAYVCAICAKTISSTSATYYFLDETGKIWQTNQSYNSTDGISFSNPTLVVDTGIGTSIRYQSIYYDGTYLYWTHTTDEDCQLIIYAPSSGRLYNAGNFGTGVWPVAGIYVNGSAAPASVDDDVVLEELNLRPVASFTDLLTEDVLARMSEAGFDLYWIPNNLTEEPVEETEPAEETEPTEEPAPAEEPVEEPVEEPAPVEGEENNAYTGSLMAFRGEWKTAPVTHVADTNVAADSEEDADTKTLTIDVSESEATHNGLISVDYDPDLLTLVSAEPTAEVSNISIFADKKGVVTIAYANKNKSGGDDLPSMSRAAYDPNDNIEAGTAIVTLTFTISCDPAEVNLTTLEINDQLQLNEIITVDVEGTGHDWAEPTWTWAEDYGTAKAAFVCNNNAEHTKELNATITSQVTPATCEAGGKTVYTATVELDGKTYTNTREVTTEATGHDWGEPTWEWAEDLSTATATFVCANDATHTKTLTATVTSEIVGHEKVYTATVELDGETYTATETVAIGITVTFDAGDGTVDPASVEINAGEAIGELPVPTREGGWVFMGWYLEPAPSLLEICQGTPVTAETVVNEDATVYAHWRLPGDVNGDGKVNTADVSLLAKYVKAHGQGVTIVPGSGDVNGDGKVNTADVSLLAKFVKARGQGVVIH